MYSYMRSSCHINISGILTQDDIVPLSLQQRGSFLKKIYKIMDFGKIFFLVAGLLLIAKLAETGMASLRFECKENGDFPDDTFCRQYWACLQLEDGEFLQLCLVCHSGTIFNETLGRCAIPHKDALLPEECWAFLDHTWYDCAH